MSRMEKINQQMKREVGQIVLVDLSDPRVEFVSITRVDVSPDLKNAKIYFSVLGESEKVVQAQAALESAAGMVRRLISQRMNLRKTPEMHFAYDKSLEESARLDETLKEIENESREDS